MTTRRVRISNPKQIIEIWLETTCPLSLPLQAIALGMRRSRRHWTRIPKTVGTISIIFQVWCDRNTAGIESDQHLKHQLRIYPKRLK